MPCPHSMSFGGLPQTSSSLVPQTGCSLASGVH